MERERVGEMMREKVSKRKGDRECELIINVIDK